MGGTEGPDADNLTASAHIPENLLPDE